MLFSEWSCALLDIMRKLLLGTLNPLLGLNLASWNSFKACIIAEAAGGVCTTRAGTGLLAAPVQLGAVCYGIRVRKCAREHARARARMPACACACARRVLVRMCARKSE